MTKTCKACKSWESRKGTEELSLVSQYVISEKKLKYNTVVYIIVYTIVYELFLSHNECDINHEGSSGSMEAAGVAECFMSSEDDRKPEADLGLLQHPRWSVL